MKINEISQMQDFRDSKEWLPAYSETGFSKLIRKSRPLPGNSKYRYVIEDNGLVQDIYITILDPKMKANSDDGSEHGTREPIGILTLKKHEWPTIAYRVNTITTHENFRNQGIAKALYLLVLRNLKITLLAGDSQTRGGAGGWNSLNNTPGVTVTGYGLLEDDVFDDLKPEALDTLLSEIMKTGGNFVGKIKRWSSTYHIFTFPAESSPQNIIRSAIKNSKLHVYDGGAYPFSFAEVGLMAKWTGK